MTIRRLLVVVCGVGLLGALLMGVVEACPSCKESLFDPAGLPQRLATAKGYAISISLMVGVPLAMVGGLTILIVRTQRKVPRRDT